MGDVVRNYDSGTAKAGGFAGVADAYDGAVTFEKCHANGKVTVADGKVGYGMIGGIGGIRYFKTTDCSYNSEKNPSLDATKEGAWEGIEGKNTAGVLYDVCAHYKGGHDMEAVAAVAATCTEDGSTAGQRCKDCNYIEGVERIAAPGHSYSADWSRDEAKHWHKCSACGDIKDEAAHTGGTATCTEKAKCEVCGESYGELNASNHADLKHFPAKAATETAEGNIEYWFCEDCGRYFADKEQTKEITQADTVTAKLPAAPKTGDEGHPVLWMTLLVVSGGAAILCRRRRAAK